MLLMIQAGIRDGMCQSIHRYAKANNKYMKNYDKIIESSYLMYLDAKNLYGWAMSQKLPANGFEWENDLSRFNERFIKKITMKVAIYNIFLNQIETIQKLEKAKKLICDIEDKEKYVIHIRALKQALNHGLILKRVHRVIQFNQEAWLKSYIDMNTKLRKEAKNEFEKDFFQLMNNSVFGKTTQNVRKHRDT